MIETLQTILGICGAVAFFLFLPWATVGTFYPLPEIARALRQMKQITFLLKNGWNLRYGYLDIIEAQAADENVWRDLSSAWERQTELNKIKRLNLPEPPKLEPYKPESWKN